MAINTDTDTNVLSENEKERSLRYNFMSLLLQKLIQKAYAKTKTNPDTKVLYTKLLNVNIDYDTLIANTLTNISEHINECMSALALILYYNKPVEECELLIKRRDATYTCFLLYNNGELTSEQLEDMKKFFYRPPIAPHLLNKQLH